MAIPRTVYAVHNNPWLATRQICISVQYNYGDWTPELEGLVCKHLDRAIRDAVAEAERAAKPRPGRSKGAAAAVRRKWERNLNEG